MKTFTTMQLDEAIAHAAAGGQALHLHRIIVDRKRAPACFNRAIERNEDIAHLFDQDKERLIRTASSCGVRVIKIDREDTPSQHIDLCAGPLRKAIGIAKAYESGIEAGKRQRSLMDESNTPEKQAS